MIPVLLVQGAGLVKTIRFKDSKYVGDPINAISIFNEKEVDELVVVDIMATLEKRAPRYDVVQDWASECFMPLCYGGGITRVSEMERLLQGGIEKVAINAAVMEHPDLIREAARTFGSQSVVACRWTCGSRGGAGIRWSHTVPERSWTTTSLHMRAGFAIWAPARYC